MASLASPQRVDASQVCWSSRRRWRALKSHGRYWSTQGRQTIMFDARPWMEQQYTEALNAQEGDSITVRLTTWFRVAVPRIAIKLSIKFCVFDDVERCLALGLDSRYDLILGMAWLERHETWIDWRSKTLGATRTVPSGALVSYEPTIASKIEAILARAVDWNSQCAGHWNIGINTFPSCQRH